MNETDVTVHSAQPTLLPQVPVLALLDATCTFCPADTHMSMLCHIRLVKAIDSLTFLLQFFITYHELSHPKLLRYVCVQNWIVYFLILLHSMATK